MMEGYLCKCSDFGPSADFQTLGIQSFDCRQSDFQLVEIALVPAVASQSQSYVLSVGQLR